MNTQSNSNETPSWYNEDQITESFDAREMLQRGEHPLEIVLSKASGLTKGAVYELITSFPPFPLIEKVKALGFESFTKQVSSNEVRTFFFKL
jgi:hypothetical protein